MRRFYLVFITMLTMFFLSCLSNADPLRIAVMDFTTVDIEASQHYIVNSNKESVSKDPVVTSADVSILTLDDLRKIAKNEIIKRQYDKAREAENIATNNRKESEKRSIMKAKLLATPFGRAVIKGSELMSVELTKYNSVFEQVDIRRIKESIEQLEFQKSGLVDPGMVKNFGKMTGATHQLYGIVGDFSVQQNKFSGYGVTTNNIIYSLDLTVKLLEVETAKIAFSSTVRETTSEIVTERRSSSDEEIALRLLKSAIAKTAEEMNVKYSK